MGTNYYLVQDCCAHCGRGNERLHIGKSSGGWCFALRVDPDNGINTLDHWKALWNAPCSKIINEYDDPVTPAEMAGIIENREWKGKEPMHSTVDESHCIGRGEGTYDYFVGEFS